MIELSQQKGESRSAFMMRVAAEYIREVYPDGIIHYDGADCDGYCIAEDLDSAREELP